MQSTFLLKEWSASISKKYFIYFRLSIKNKYKICKILLQNQLSLIICTHEHRYLRLILQSQLNTYTHTYTPKATVTTNKQGPGQTFQTPPVPPGRLQTSSIMLLWPCPKLPQSGLSRENIMEIRPETASSTRLAPSYRSSERDCFKSSKVIWQNSPEITF